MNRITRLALGGLAALALTTQARAQAPAPPPAAGAAASAEQARQAIDTVHQWTVHTQTIGALIQQRGSSAKVKELAQRMASDANAIDQEAKQLAQKRGITLTPDETAKNDPGLQRTNAELKNLSGADFDRRVTSLLADDHAAWVARLKQFRDQTSDKDAELKGWLDRVENRGEEQSKLAFQARRAASDEQVQGRTAPAR